ncbi:MAG: hypothetical protein Fur006_31530 [Coleofasciculaceae cyanobacterium]
MLYLVNLSQILRGTLSLPKEGQACVMQGDSGIGRYSGAVSCVIINLTKFCVDLVRQNLSPDSKFIL